MTQNMASGITSLRLTANKIVIPFLWLHVPLIFGLAMALDTDWMWPTIGAIALAGVTTFCWMQGPTDLVTRLTAAVSFVGIIGLLLSLLHGREWQLDMHMYFFAALAILVVYCDWRVIVMGAAAVACHHLILNFVFPSAIYPSGADFFRVVFHAAIVVLEAAVLIFITYKLTVLFATSEESIQAMEAAREREVVLEREQADLRVKVEQERKRSMLLLASNFEKSVKGVVDSVSAAANHVQMTAKSLAGNAEETSQQSNAVAAASEETSVSVQTVAASAVELTSSIEEIGSQVNKAAHVTTKAATDGENANITMQTLAATAQKIGEVVHLIQGIAGQTNLLALNATIEAARAGEAGKGFAVVASEVKSLANQTAHATEDIEKQVSTIQTETKSAVLAIAEICKTLIDVKSVSSSIASAIEEQSAATQEIARNVQQAAQGTARISHNVTEVTKTAQGTKDVANQMLTSSSELAQQSAILHKEVNAFLSSVRQA